MMIAVVLLLGYLIYYLYTNNGEKKTTQSSGDTSVEVLKRRYINGEIDEETYRRMLAILNN